MRGWLAAVLLLVATACSGGPDADTLSQAATATRAVGMVEVELSGTAFSAPSRPLGSFEASGIVDLADGDRRMSVTVALAEAEPYTLEAVRVDALVHLAGLPGVEEDGVVIVDGAPDGISADLPAFVDPVALLALIDGLVGDVTDLGEEEVAGVATDHVRVLLPPARMERAIESIVTSLGPEAEAAITAQGAVTASGTAEVWIDADGVVRRLQLRTTAGVGSGSIPGIGAVDNVVLMELRPAEDPQPIEPPREVDGVVPFGQLIGTD